MLVLVRPVFERIVVLGSARAGERFLGDLRVAAFDKLQQLSMPFFEETRAGVLVSRLTNDVQTLTTFTRMVLVEVVGSVLLFVVTLVILVTLSPLLSLVMLISVPLLVWSSLRYGKRSRPAFLDLRDRVAETMSSLQEGLTGVRVLQSYRRETDRYASYRVRSRAQVAAWRRISLVNIGFFPMIAFAQSLALASVLVVGGYLERHGRVTVGTIVAFSLYLISLFDPIARLGDWYTEFQSGRAALTKIAELLAEPVTVGGRDGVAARLRNAVGDRRHVRLRRRRARGGRHLAERRAQASISRSSAPPAPGSRRSRSCSFASTTRRKERSRSTASTCARSPPTSCAGASSSCRRRGICSRARSPTTSGSAGRTRPTTRCARRSRRSAHSSGSSASRTGWARTCARAASASRPASASWSRSRASRSPTRP